MTVRFCLRCGRALRRVRDEGHWRRRCAACGWTFYGNPVPAVGAVVVRGVRVLLVRRAHPPYAGTWDIPGGFLEAGETPERALRRELREELGARVVALRAVGFAVDRYGPQGFPILSIVFRTRLARGRLRASDDVSALRWFERTEIPWRQIAFPGLRKLVRRHLG